MSTKNKHFYPFVACIVAVITSLSGCDNEKEGKRHLSIAETLYSQGNYSEAKIQIDSIKIACPKAFGLQKKGLELMRKVECEELKRNVAYADSMMAVLTTQSTEIEKDLVLQKDEKYQQEGHWVSKTQNQNTNYLQSSLQTKVSEKGVISITSVYYGVQSLNHTAIKVTSSNGNYAQSEVVAYDGGRNYRFKNLGTTTEKITFNSPLDNGVIEFIYNNIDDSKLRIEFLGDRTASLTLKKQDKESFKKLYELSILLSDFEKLQKEKAISMQRMEYLKKKIETSETPNKQ